MLHAAAREGLFCPAYCLMPDHVHLIWLGLKRETDQRKGMAFLRTHLKPFLAPIKFQPQAHDHVLHDEERKRNAFAKICFFAFISWPIPFAPIWSKKLRDGRFAGPLFRDTQIFILWTKVSGSCFGNCIGVNVRRMQGSVDCQCARRSNSEKI